MKTQLHRFQDYAERHSYTEAVKALSKEIRKRLYTDTVYKYGYVFNKKIFTYTCGYIPGLAPISVYKRNGNYVVRNEDHDEAFLFPTEPTYHQLRHVSAGYSKLMGKKYSNSFVDVEPNDVVVDIGAFVGAYSLYACQKASEVFAIEPSSKNFGCLSENTKKRLNVHPKNVAIHLENTDIELNLSSDPTDHSLIEVDAGETGKQEIVDAYTLDSFLNETSINKIDLLKIDAEGLEPEVLQSVTEHPVRKIAVDCSAERGGESTVESVTQILENRGYSYEAGNVVYAVKE